VIYLGQEHLVRLPDSLAPEEVALAVLNYVTAYQMRTVWPGSRPGGAPW
jgi:NADPH:quinone reductase-like Zn-dependent oxidoreductase